MRTSHVIAVFLLAAALAAPQTPQIKENQAQPKAIPAFDLRALDRSASPCVDFFQFACGNWIKNNPIPADRARWGRFDELQENNQAILRTILEKAAPPDPTRDEVHQKIGDYYASCMDEAAINKQGLSALQKDLGRIAGLKDKGEIPDLLAYLHSRGVSALFDVDSEQDFADATKMIAVVDQAGLGLPDRDYYFKPDPKSAEIRDKYVLHVGRMLELMGEPPDKAKADAKVVMDMETTLAGASMDLVSRRDPQKIYHMTTLGELSKLSPAFPWPRYFTDVNLRGLSTLNVRVPDFFKQVSASLDKVSLDDWKTYLRWHLVHAAAPILPVPFVNENFQFYGLTLTGQKEIRPRWKRCVAYTDMDLGEALGQPYVDLTFGVEGKQRTLHMVEALEQALKSDIEQLAWMTPATKKQALVKLEGIRNKIGYPDKWRDYSKLNVVRGDALGNWFRGKAFEFNRELAKVGKPPDPNEWGMTPPTVNAYYDPQMNNINFPAGILQPPFYDNKAGDAVNFGGIGVVIGHELTHGFDDEGRQFDAKGNLRDWWTPADAKAFEDRTACFVKEYGSFTSGGVNLNGELTLGENTADNGGARVSLMALESVLAQKPQERAKVDGFTPEQRFFISFAQIWCENQREEVARLLAQTNPHSPGTSRVNGVVSNMSEFQQAFSCRAGQPMVKEPPCRVW